MSNASTLPSLTLFTVEVLVTLTGARYSYQRGIGVRAVDKDAAAVAAVAKVVKSDPTGKCVVVYVDVMRF